jgi:hypothetical protein
MTTLGFGVNVRTSALVVLRQGLVGAPSVACPCIAVMGLVPSSV